MNQQQNKGTKFQKNDQTTHLGIVMIENNIYRVQVFIKPIVQSRYRYYGTHSTADIIRNCNQKEKLTKENDKILT